MNCKYINEPISKFKPNKEDIKITRWLLDCRQLTEEAYRCIWPESMDTHVTDYGRFQTLKPVQMRPDADYTIEVTPDIGEEVAVKMIMNDDIFTRTLVDWPRLKHENVLKLIYAHHIPKLDMHCFFTENHHSYMPGYLESDLFLQDSTGLQKIQKFTKEILSAVHYLHRKKFCHLGLHLGSIHISHKISAVVGNLYCFDSTEAPSHKYRVYGMYYAPETWNVEKSDFQSAVMGVPFDIWCLGILTLDMCTQSYGQKTLPPDPQSWTDDVYPNLFAYVQKKKFRKSVQKALPACKVGRKTTGHIWNFITTCLNHRPEDRLSAYALMQHIYIESTGSLSKPEDMWKKKVTTWKPEGSRKQGFMQWVKNVYLRMRIVCL